MSLPSALKPGTHVLKLLKVFEPSAAELAVSTDIKTCTGVEAEIVMSDVSDLVGTKTVCSIWATAAWNPKTGDRTVVKTRLKTLKASKREVFITDLVK